MLIPSYTAAALTGENGVDDPDAGRRKRLGREPEAARGPDKGSGTTRVPKTRAQLVSSSTGRSAGGWLLTVAWAERRGGGTFRPGAGSVVNRCGGGWSAVADAPSAPPKGGVTGSAFVVS